MNFAFRRESDSPARLTSPGLATAVWFRLLALCLFLVIGQESFGQTMTLSAPNSSGTAVDNMAVVFSISGETGTIASVRLVMTYTSGYSTASIGSAWTLTMVSKSATQSFSFNPSTATSSALFSSISPATNPPDGVYSVKAEYTRGLNSAIVTSNTAASVTVDTGALPPSFNYVSSVTINTSTDVITLSGHLLSTGAAVTVSGTDVSSSTTYYVSLIDANSFKLTTTLGGSTFVDFTTATSPTITYPTMTGDVRTLGSTTASFYYTIPESYFGSSAKLTFTGHTTVVVTLGNGVRINRVTFDRTNIVTGGGILATTSSTLPDDTYTVTLTYRDLNNHTSTAATLLYMFYDAGTVVPSFTSLVNNAAITDGSTIPYTLPEAPYGGTVKLTFSNSTTTTVVPLTNATSATFTYNRSLHAATIPAGTYTVTLSYQDTAGNAVASKTVTGVAVTVTPFSTTTDTDGDGLNDAAEVALAALGFDWQVAQPALVTAFLNNALFTQSQMNTNRTAGQTDVTSNPSAYSLYSLSQLKNLQVGTPVITKDTVSGKWKLTVGLQKSTDLTNYTAFPFISSGTTVNSSGEVEFLFTVPEDSAFFRVSTF